MGKLCNCCPYNITTRVKCRIFVSECVVLWTVGLVAFNCWRSWTVLVLNVQNITLHWLCLLVFFCFVVLVKNIIVQIIAVLLSICVDRWHRARITALGKGTRRLRNWYLHSKMIVTCLIKINRSRALRVAATLTNLHYYWQRLWSRNSKVYKYGISVVDQEGLLGVMLLVLYNLTQDEAQTCYPIKATVSVL